MLLADLKIGTWYVEPWVVHGCGRATGSLRVLITIYASSEHLNGSFLQLVTQTVPFHVHKSMRDLEISPIGLYPSTRANQIGIP